jgi:hypothetical protein
MTDDCAHEAPPFAIDGPDGEGCVWLRSTIAGDTWCRNLGQKDQVVNVLHRWLRTVGSHQKEDFWAPLLNGEHLHKVAKS